MIDMAHPSSKSPDPPDGVVDVAMDEDSQESTTLQNALEPLPDTQATSQGYQQAYTENYTGSAAPVISRPAQPHAGDLSIGFSFHKPSTVKPGQFCGRQQSKPFKPIMGHSADMSDPEVYKEPPLEQTTTMLASAVGRSNPAMCSRLLSPKEKETVQQQPPRTQADQNVTSPVEDCQASHLMQNHQRQQTLEGLATAVSLPRKKRPFPDYQPTYRASGPQKQLPTPVNSCPTPSDDHMVNLRSGPGLAFDKGADLQRNHQRQTVQSSTVNIAQQKSRTSFQNDISVSSALPPKSMPGSSPRATVNDRPTKDSHQRTSRLNTPATRPRSSGFIFRSSHSIVKSNSKAKRSSHASQVSSSSRFSDRYADHDEETPSMKQRSKWTPAELLQNRFHQKLVTTAADLAGCFNDKFADIGAEVDQHLQTISDLKKGMSKQRHDLSRYKECISGKDDKIQQLEEHCDQLLAQVDTTRQELDARSTKVSKLEEKCRSYKDFLNKAIAEQQDLYKATKTKCDGAITKMQAEETKRIAFQERERKRAEEIRKKLNQLVQSTVTEYKQKERDFNNQIEVLNEKVQEREADVMREREIANALLQQNDSVKKIQDTMKTFQQQIMGVVGKVNEAVAQRYQQDDQSAKELNVKLDQIMQYLRVLDEQTLPTADLSKEMRELNERNMMSISERLEPIISSQLHTKIGLDALCSGVEACMNDVWEELDERQTMLEDCFLKQEAEREQHVVTLQQDLRSLELELAQQNRLLLRSAQELRAREATIEGLQHDISNLSLEQEEHLARSEQLHRIREEYETLKHDSATKATLVSEIQKKLQDTTAMLVTEQEKHQEREAGVQRHMEQQVAEARAAQVQAVEATQQDALLRINEIKADNDARLTQAWDNCTALQKELDEAKQKMISIEAKRSSTFEKAMNLEKELQSSRAEVAKGRDQDSLKEAEHQSSKEQQLKFIDDLQTKLASAEERFNTLSGNTKLYDKAAQAILLSMKEWTQNYVNIQPLYRELRRNRTKNGTLRDIDSKLKPLVELQLLQTAVAQHCQTQKEATQMSLRDSALAKTPSSLYTTFDSLDMVASNALDRFRRVTVMSPASNMPSPQPPSIQNEQERRRMGEQPKSILKLVPRPRRNSEEEARRDLLGEMSINRGPYNRLVAGRKPQTGLPDAQLSQKTLLGKHIVLDQGAGTAPGFKRKQEFEQNSYRQEDRTVKRKSSTDLKPGFSSPPKYDDDGPVTDSVVPPLHTKQAGRA